MLSVTAAADSAGSPSDTAHTCSSSEPGNASILLWCFTRSTSMSNFRIPSYFMYPRRCEMYFVCFTMHGRGERRHIKTTERPTKTRPGTRITCHCRPENILTQEVYQLTSRTHSSRPGAHPRVFSREAVPPPRFKTHNAQHALVVPRHEASLIENARQRHR